MTRFADAHNDLLHEVAHRAHEPNPFGRHWLGKMRDGHVALTVCAVACGLEQLPEGGLRVALHQCGAFHRALRENPADLVWARGAGDLAEAEREGRIALVLSMEGVEPFGYSAALLEPFIALGVRMVGLTWNRRNPFADGLQEHDSDGGLSRLGRTLVDALVERHIAIDLAHASPRTVDQVLARAACGHLLVSHAGCRSVYDTSRNLSDAQLTAIAAAGGLIGVMPHPVTLGIGDGGATLDKAVDHLDHARRVVGVDRLAIGADFTRQLVRSGGLHIPPDIIMPEGMAPDAAVEGLEGPHHFPYLADRMQARGWSRAECDAVLHDNLRAFLDGVLDHHEPSCRPSPAGHR
ncbi:dipeptidase [Pseudonocardia kunmingensis]|uniref:Membrane dipeptidase n=1 Tax=Pseudonocardia kunmingensis TaxID=630975 RepID=A0A543DQJ9_9PSEU|nr:membrane dipeptidase [Pseudonocardia kunmingensis]TQM11610.1 membrane dipeptidase [Pseudonocardia kunmingensis]